MGGKFPGGNVSGDNFPGGIFPGHFSQNHYHHVTLAFQSESTLYSFRTSCSKQAQQRNMEIQRFKHSRLLCSRFLDPFNENVHYVKSVETRNFFWSVFSRIWTEYGDLLHKFPYSVRMRENTDQKKLHIWTLFKQWCFAKEVQINISRRDSCWCQLFLASVKILRK